MFKGSGLRVFEALRFWVCGMGFGVDEHLEVRMPALGMNHEH